MKYIITIFATAVLVFLGATIYYKGIPGFEKPEGISVVNENISASPSPTAVPGVSEEEILREAVFQSLLKKYGSNAQGLTVDVHEISGEYASGTVSENGSGGGWYAARLNGQWTLVWDGNGQIDCLDISPYPEFPTAMIPECWDSSASALIVR